MKNVLIALGLSFTIMLIVTWLSYVISVIVSGVIWLMENHSNIGTIILVVIWMGLAWYLHNWEKSQEHPQ